MDIRIITETDLESTYSSATYKVFFTKRTVTEYKNYYTVRFCLVDETSKQQNSIGSECFYYDSATARYESVGNLLPLMLTTLDLLGITLILTNPNTIIDSYDLLDSVCTEEGWTWEKDTTVVVSENGTPLDADDLSDAGYTLSL